MAKKDSALSVRLKKMTDKVTRSDDEVAAYEKNRAAMLSNKMVKDAVGDVKNYIAKQPQPHEQLLFSFMPTSMTRTSPFFPMNKRQMKDRPLEKGLTWETSWGQITISGERLSVYDETVLLTLLILVKKHQSEAFETTLYALCKLANVKPATNTYNAIWQSIIRLSKTDIALEKVTGKGRSKKTVEELGGNIITFRYRNRKTGKIKLVLNPYFLEMYAEGFLTNLNLKFRAQLKGDVSKALYRFYEGQEPFYGKGKYEIHLLKLCRAINLATDNVQLRRLREQVRNGLKELRKQGFLQRWQLNKKDAVTVWKGKAKLLS